MPRPRNLVLSIFPGIGLLNRAFEESGFCVVRGPDVGGPPCPTWSRLGNLVRATGRVPAPDLIPEFVRCVREAAPEWWIMEQVPDAPVPYVVDYRSNDQLVSDHWCGGETMRRRRFTYGTHAGRRLEIDWPALHRPDPEPAALASGSSWNSREGIVQGSATKETFRNHKRLQGLPADYDIPCFTVAAKVKAVGNGVPMAMGRAVARAVAKQHGVWS